MTEIPDEIMAKARETFYGVITFRSDSTAERAIATIAAALLSERTASEAERKEAREVIAREVHRATNAEYIAHAYYNMLGEKGLEVAKMWSVKGVNRVHFEWGPEAGQLTGEERAALILTWETAPRRLVENIDGDDIPRTSKPKVNFAELVESLAKTGGA